MAVVRPIVLTLAFVACAWFVLGIRQAHEIDSVRAIVSAPAPLSAGAARHATDLLSDAATLNPDLEVDVLRGQVAIGLGRLAEARRILSSVVHREPDNLAAWVRYAQAARDDPRLFLVAVKQAERLVRQFPKRP